MINELRKPEGHQLMLCVTATEMWGSPAQVPQALLPLAWGVEERWLAELFLPLSSGIRP